MIPLHSEQIYYKSGLFKKVLPFHSLMLLYNNSIFFIHMNCMHNTLNENLISVK